MVVRYLHFHVPNFSTGFMGRIAYLLNVFLIFYFCVSVANAATVTCEPKDENDSWIKKISIDTQSGKVVLEIVRFRTRDGATFGKLDAILENMEERQFGEPIYAFNSYPSSEAGVTHVFKLFKSLDDWRLINAGLVYVRGKPTLRALDSSRAYRCKTI